MQQLSIHTFLPPVNAGEIIRIQASINYSKIYFAENKPVIVPRVLQWFEEQLEKSGFIRVHRSHLINKAFVHQYFQQGEKPFVKLLNGEEVPISRRKHTRAKLKLAS
ncbi:MAG: LytTR family transcriptional regulator [Chitinophagaceae bacterium]|jgi:two-component system LytT family response regulator|nr:LytTR family transcriptional regulator [Chitinophagaceae bacterium]